MGHYYGIATKSKNVSERDAYWRASEIDCNPKLTPEEIVAFKKLEPLFSYSLALSLLG